MPPTTPPSPARTAAKAPNVTGTSPAVANKRALRPHEDTSSNALRRHCTGPAASPIPASKGQERGNAGGRTAIRRPTTPSPSPKPQNTPPVFVDHPKKEPPKSTAPKGAGTKQPIKAPCAVRTRVGLEAGRGRTGPPWRTRREGRTPKVAEAGQSFEVLRAACTGGQRTGVGGPYPHGASLCPPPPPGLGVCIGMPLVNGTGHSPVSGTADPRSSQTGQVIRGLR